MSVDERGCKQFKIKTQFTYIFFMSDKNSTQNCAWIRVCLWQDLLITMSGRPERMPHRKWRKTKQQLMAVLGRCLALYLLCDILPVHPAYKFPTSKNWVWVACSASLNSSCICIYGGHAYSQLIVFLARWNPPLHDLVGLFISSNFPHYTMRLNGTLNSVRSTLHSALKLRCFICKTKYAWHAP